MSDDGLPPPGKGSHDTVDAKADEVSRLIEEFAAAPPRAQAILAAALLEEDLRVAVRRALVVNDHVAVQLLGDGVKGGELSFIWQARLAYTLAIIGPMTLADIEQICRVRNMFAHRTSKSNFDDPEIKKLCAKLATPDAETKLPSANFHFGKTVLSSYNPEAADDRYFYTIFEIMGGLAFESDAREIRTGPWVLM
jgi:DNA-binding MltR family transcriptional regulator